jgi:DHA2 family multidrug resistance protein
MARTSIILSGLSPERIPAAAGLSNFVRIMFGGIGRSLTTTLWDNRTAVHHAQLAEHTGPHNQAFSRTVEDLTAHGLSEQGAWAVIEWTMSVQASTLAATDIFWMSAVLFGALIGLVWLTRSTRG